MKLYRVEVRLERMGGSRWHDAKPFAAIGETPEEAARHAMAVYASGAWMGDPPPIGAIAVELTEAAISMDDAVEAIDRDALKKLAKSPEWVVFETPSMSPRP